MKYRPVPVSFWTNPDLEDISPENMYFMLMLMTNPETTSIGVYRITYRQMAFYSKYDQISVKSIMERFRKLGLIQYDDERKEIYIKGFAKYSINRGGKPMQDLIRKELEKIENVNFIEEVYNDVKANDLKEVIQEKIDTLNESWHESCNDTGGDIDRDKDNDRDIDRDNIKIAENKIFGVPSDSEKLKNDSPLNDSKKEKKGPTAAQKKEKEIISEVMDYLNEKIGRTLRSDSTAARQIWHRFKEDATVEEMKAVISDKVKEWKGTKMEKYLHPKTLFLKSNYDTYVEQLSKGNQNNEKLIQQFKPEATSAIMDAGLEFLWDANEENNLIEFCRKISESIKQSGGIGTTSEINEILGMVIRNLPDFYRQAFSFATLTRNYNKVINSIKHGKQQNKTTDFEEYVRNKLRTRRNYQSI